MKIGWASRDVTPDKPVALRGQFHLRISESVNDPLTLTALALEAPGQDGKPEQSVMVSCDRVSIPPGVIERCRELLADRLPELDGQKLFLSATHTHSAPQIRECVWALPPEVMTPSEYGDIFVEGVAEAVIEAWEARKPGAVGWAFGHAVVGHNRRTTYADGSSKMYGSTNDPAFRSIEGYEDHGVDMLFTWDETSRLTGVVVNLACPSQVTESVCYVSADFWHEAREELRGRFSDDLFVLPQCSAAGDQSPRCLLHAAAEERMLDLKGVSQRQEIAIRIADAVEASLPLAESDIRTDAPLKHIVKSIQLPRRMVTEEELALAQQECARLEAQQPASDREASVITMQLHRNRRVITRYGTQREQPLFPMELHVVRLGDIAFATSPFELFLDFGLRIKARSKAVQTFVVQLVGVGLEDEPGYLPTARAVAAKSYGAEVVSNPVGPEGGQELVEATLDGIDEVL